MPDQPIWNCERRFEFLCPKQWTELVGTPDPGIRGCTACQKLVYFCQSEHEAREHARQGHCIALPTRALARSLHPEEPERWKAMALQHGLPFTLLSDHVLEPSIVRGVPDEALRRHNLLPLSRKGDSLVVATSDPGNVQALEEVKFYTGLGVEVVVASPWDIEETRERILNEDSRETLMGVFMEEELEEAPDEDPDVRLLQRLLFNIRGTRVDEIQFEAVGPLLFIRQRVDGTLQEASQAPVKLWESIARALQHQWGARPDLSGRFQLRVSGKSIDYQVHIRPTEQGQEMVFLRVTTKTGET